MERNGTSTSGYCHNTQIYHSLRPAAELPPETTLLSAASYALSLHSASPFPASTPAFIPSATASPLSHSHFLLRVANLQHSLRSLLSKTDSSDCKFPANITKKISHSSDYKFHVNKTKKKYEVAYVLAPNTPHLPVLFFALLQNGVVISPANPLTTPSQISRHINICKPVIAFATSAFAHKLKLHTLKYGVVVIDSPEFESMLMTPASFEPAPVEVEQSDVAAIMYSSGTTGDEKGVSITHRNLIAAMSCHYSVRGEREFPRVVLHIVPYFHIFGFVYCMRAIALKETAVVLERYELGKMLRAVEEYRVNFMPVVPPIVVAMVKEKGVGVFDLNSLEVVSSGGSSLRKDVIAKFESKYPNVLLAQGYGLTETTGVAFRAVTAEEISRWGSVGKMFSTFQAKIVDPTSAASLPPFRKGELWLRSPSIMKGYVDNPKATSDTIVPDGWLRTGDICYFDDEGHLFVVDRLKELIKYKGHQVPPAELEALLLSHPQILDVAVIPYPDEEAGEVPMAFVARYSQSSLDESEVMDFVAKQVAPFKKVRRVRFITTIPKTPAGKILRKELRKIAMLESKI